MNATIQPKSKSKATAIQSDERIAGSDKVIGGYDLHEGQNRYYYRSSLLADHLEKSQDPRILNACTTNIKNFFDPKRKIDFDNLRGEFRNTRRYSAYKMYGDSKMALLILTFKIAEEFKNRGIKVNALQINRVKRSKETIIKLSPFWKMLAWAQNMTNPLVWGLSPNTRAIVKMLKNYGF